LLGVTTAVLEVLVFIPLRKYAQREGISIGAAYLRVWNGRVQSEKRDGRIYVNPEPQATGKHGHDVADRAELETA
jgi:hypothetical protein